MEVSLQGLSALEGELTPPPSSVLLANLVHITLNPTLRLLMTILKCTELSMDTSGTPLVTRCKPDVIPFNTSLCAQPMNQLLTHHTIWLSSCVLAIFVRKDTVRDTIKISAEVLKDYIY